MHPRTITRLFSVRSAGVVALLGLGIIYGLAMGIASMPQVRSEHSFNCAKLGINCDRVCVPTSPGFLDRFAATIVGQSWDRHIAARALFMVVGFGAYWFRCRAQVLYGFAAIVASLGFCATFLYALNVQDLRVFQAAVGVLGAVYIGVRGMDNVEKGLGRVPDLHKRWRRFWCGDDV